MFLSRHVNHAKVVSDSIALFVLAAVDLPNLIAHEVQFLRAANEPWSDAAERRGPARQPCGYEGSPHHAIYGRWNEKDGKDRPGPGWPTLWNLNAHTIARGPSCREEKR